MTMSPFSVASVTVAVSSAAMGGGGLVGQSAGIPAAGGLAGAADGVLGRAA